jgi:hypothetical protein
MAAHFVTINEEINVFGPTTASLWGSTTLGSGRWGYSTSLTTKFFQNVVEAPAVADEVSLSDVWRVLLRKIISETVGVRAPLNDINLRDAEGYYYEYALPTVDSEDRDTTQFSEQSDPSTTWTAASRPSTTWQDIYNPTAPTEEDGA